ncbi:MAG: cytochrome b/b6 domain-containing protein [Dehalococcoidia bacterium]|nr:cytochrome b/b6 domain-containing protein [Dehalococcoidia bacterium]
MEEQWIERYRKPTRILHWVYAACFLVLLATGLILFLPPLAALAQDSWTRIIHRVASVIIIIAPIVYLVFNWKSALKGLADAFDWGWDDIGWLIAAPRYYFLADEKAMPPQHHMNTGQKMWWLIVIVSGLVFTVTGIIMWAFKTTAPAAVLQWSVFAHDAVFVVTTSMLLLHVYLSVIHPLMRPLRTGAWSSMARGKVSVEYAKSHHGKWYEEVVGRKEAESEWEKVEVTTK